MEHLKEGHIKKKYVTEGEVGRYREIMVIEIENQGS